MNYNISFNFQGYLPLQRNMDIRAAWHRFNPHYESLRHKCKSPPRRRQSSL